MRRQVEKMAATLNFQDPDDAYLRLKDELKVDEKTGAVTGLKEALEQLAKDKPYLVKAAGTGTAAPNINVTAGGGQAGAPLSEVVERKRRTYGAL